MLCIYLNSIKINNHKNLNIKLFLINRWVVAKVILEYLFQKLVLLKTKMKKKTLSRDRSLLFRTLKEGW